MKASEVSGVDASRREHQHRQCDLRFQESNRHGEAKGLSARETRYTIINQRDSQRHSVPVLTPIERHPPLAPNPAVL